MPVNSFEDYPMAWKPAVEDRAAPIYPQLVSQLAQDIRAGRLKPGDRLPPQRELADFLDIHPSTVTRAYKACEKRGLICAKVGQGTFVASDVNASDTLLYGDGPPVIQLGTVVPPDNGDEKIVAFIRELLTQPDIRGFLSYGSPSGTYTQRRHFAQWAQTLGVQTSEQAVMLATGGQNALFAALLGLFSPGDRIGTSALSFSGLKAAARMVGVQLTALPEKDGALDCGRLCQFCRQENLKGLYFVPEQHTPTTRTMTEEERMAAAQTARELGLVLIEDAVNRVLGGGNAPPLCSLAPKHTVYILTTSKFLSPGLRVAYLLAPEPYREGISRALYNMNLMVSPLNAEIVNRLLGTPLLAELIGEKRREIAARSAIARRYLGGCRMYGEESCAFRWLMLGRRWTGQSFERAALGAGVQVFGAERFAIGNAPAPPAVRLCLTAPRSRVALSEALSRLAPLLDGAGEET